MVERDRFPPHRRHSMRDANNVVHRSAVDAAPVRMPKPRYNEKPQAALRLWLDSIERARLSQRITNDGR